MGIDAGRAAFQESDGLIDRFVGDALCRLAASAKAKEQRRDWLRRQLHGQHRAGTAVPMLLADDRFQAVLLQAPHCSAGLPLGDVLRQTGDSAKPGHRPDRAGFPNA